MLNSFEITEIKRYLSDFFPQYVVRLENNIHQNKLKITIKDQSFEFDTYNLYYLIAQITFSFFVVSNDFKKLNNLQNQLIH